MENEYPPVTKETLISAILTMFKDGSLTEELTLHEIKRFATDERLKWAEKEYNPLTLAGASAIIGKAAEERYGINPYKNV